ncbi:MAG: transcriptional regulator, partial [Polyangiaceae bacterium]
VEGAEPAFRCAEIRQRGPSPIAERFHKAPCAVNAAMQRAEKLYRAELEKVSVASLNADPRSALGAAISQRSCSFLELHQRRTKLG